MAKKNITIDELAAMVQNEFEETRKETRSGFTAVNKRFDKIENLVLASHQKRIEKLEDEVKELREMFAM